ncbi:MAG: hypothetical protein RIQ97_477 [Pseudomonadota bacterium]|jgi:AAA15 family ATPase/GTPase
MIEIIKIDNFKGLKKLEISNLPKISIFGGKNNAGKSSLIEAIFYCLDRENPLLLNRHFEFRATPTPNVITEDYFSPIFHNFNLEKLIQIEISGSKILKNQFEIEFIRNYNKNRDSSIKDNPLLRSIAKTSQGTMAVSLTHKVNSKLCQKTIISAIGPANLNIDKQVSINTQSIEARFLSSNRRSNYSDECEKFGILDKNNKKDTYISLIKNFDSRITDASVISINQVPLLHVGMHGLNKKIPIAYAGDGLNSLSSIILCILSSNNSIILIDEIENGIHYSMHKTFWEAISMSMDYTNSQLITTSHSKEMIIAANSVFQINKPEHFKYYRLNNNDDANSLSRITEYSSEEISQSIDFDMEIR